MKAKSLSNQRGMTLIEVLVSSVVIAVGILGAVSLQSFAQKGSFDSMQRSVATALAQDMIERMRSNEPDPNEAILSGYAGTYGSTAGATTPPAPTVDCNAVANECTPAELRTQDLSQWNQLLLGTNVASSSDVSLGGLLGVTGCIAFANQQATITISWEGRNETTDSNSASTCGTTSNKRRQLSLTTFIY